MAVDVMYLNFHEEIPDDDFWDYSMLKAYFRNEIWNPAGAYLDLEESENLIIIAGRYHQKDVKKINKHISKLDWCILFIMGDEENDFPVEQLEHPRMDIWVMSPRPGHHDPYHKIGSGWPQQIRDIKPEWSEKPNEWFFSGQTVHDQRKQMAEVLTDLPRGELNETEGFTQGYPHAVYYEKMNAAKALPCPSGSFTPDSFRMYEALELGGVPLVGAMPSVAGYPDNYWTNLFGEVPFPIVSDWNGLPHEITTVRENWPGIGNKVFAWWQNYKREQAYELHDNVYRYRNERPSLMLKDKLTVIIPTSPIKSHPNSHIIDTTIKTVRDRLPDCEILIMCDGVRPEQEHLKDDYQLYLNQLLWKCNWEYKNVLPIIFDEYTHQASMTRETLKKVRTPTILFVEHDTPLEGDIPFESLVNTVMDNTLDMIRLHHETKIGDYHQHLMLDSEPIMFNDTPYVRTVQWSQRPHVASTAYYRNILDAYFSPQARTMIEDKMHSVAQTEPWDNHRLAIYHNEGNIQHSVNLDGRENDPKWHETYVF